MNDDMYILQLEAEVAKLRAALDSCVLVIKEMQELNLQYHIQLGQILKK